jgi:hypothetical protein
MNIFVVNHSVENCGVYQYGKRVGKILEKSKKNNFIYLELDTEEEFRKQLSIYSPEIIIYNYLSGTMPWMNEILAQELREFGIVQMLLVHNVNYSTFFDYYLHQNPDYTDDDKNFAICRPLFDYDSNLIEDTDVLKIGSFGFGFRVKYFDEICRVVNEQLYDRNVEIRLHLTHSHFCENANDIQGIKQECLSRITSPNIKLTMTHDFLTDIEMLDFLSQNNLNIFFYQDYPSYNGISSTIDYALSVKKPIAICKSRMFSHIMNVEPSICVEDNYLLDIINNGFSPLKEKYEKWTNIKFIDRIEKIIGEVI